jgi:hypothetical protein
MDEIKGTKIVYLLSTASRVSATDNASLPRDVPTSNIVIYYMKQLIVHIYKRNRSILLNKRLNNSL